MILLFCLWFCLKSACNNRLIVIITCLFTQIINYIMEKFFIIAKRDENNPVAFETLLRLNSRNGDTFLVMYLNVENTPEQVTYGCKWLQNRINNGKIQASEEAKKLVNRLCRTACRSGSHHQCKKKFADYVRRQLKLNKLDADDCLILYRAS